MHGPHLDIHAIALIAGALALACTGREIEDSTGSTDPETSDTST